VPAPEPSPRPLSARRRRCGQSARFGSCDTGCRRARPAGSAEHGAARLLDALSSLPWGVARELDPEEVARRPITIVGDDPRVDVLTTAWNVTFDRAWPARMVRRIDGVRVPYLSLADLRASKQTGRPSDVADLQQLAAPDLEDERAAGRQRAVRRRPPRRR
jgi:hypothetical protein